MEKRKKIAVAIYTATAIWCAFLLLSLRFGFLKGFFYDTMYAHVQGIDFFPVAKSFRNLLAGRSIFDTFGAPMYGPYATWFLYHPASSILLGLWFGAMAPWTAYCTWTALSLALMGVAAWVIARCGSDPVRKALVTLLMMGSFPAFIMLYVGNVQAVVVLAVALILAAVETIREEGATRRSDWMLLAGLLLSLFSKPVVLAMLPLLLMLKQTRKAAVRAIAVYAVVSLAFLVLPFLNPDAMSWKQRADLATHPETVRQTMNIYTNNFVVTPPMKDNSVHWLAMMGLSDYRMLHVDVYSLSAFLDMALQQHTAEAWFRAPGILVLEMSLLVMLIDDNRKRLEAAATVLMAATMMLFVTYGLVWEYHYTMVFPVVAVLLMRQRQTIADGIICALGLIVWLPSLFIFVNAGDATSQFVQTLIRVDRVVPAALIFCILVGKLAAEFAAQGVPGILRGAFKTHAFPSED